MHSELIQSFGSDLATVPMASLKLATSDKTHTGRLPERFAPEQGAEPLSDRKLGTWG